MFAPRVLCASARALSRPVAACAPALARAAVGTRALAPAALASRRYACDVVYPAARAHVNAPAPGFTAPAVVGGEIKSVSLDSFRGKYVVLLFYPKDFTYVCPTELIAFSDRAVEFERLNTQVLAISTDTEESHLAWVRMPRHAGGLGSMQIPIVADTKKTISAEYGTLFKEEGIAFRGLFIIDPHGVLQQVTINNLPVGRSVDETLRLLNAFQFVAEHGEVCPANWKPGDRAMKADAEDSHEYFSAVWGQEGEAPPSDTQVTSVASVGEAHSILGQHGLVVMKFEAAWCHKCRMIAPHVSALADEFPNVKFVSVDTGVTELHSLKHEYAVDALPTFVLFKNGKRVGQVLGYKKRPLREAVEALVA